MQACVTASLWKKDGWQLLLDNVVEKIKWFISSCPAIPPQNVI
jgi:hypothetical protein